MSGRHELITVHDGNLIQVRIPVPLALKSVNSYLLKDGEGFVWIDPTLNTKHIQDIWHDVFNQLNIDPKRIYKIICTHQHPDHFGLAGYAQKLTNAPVYMSQNSINHANALWKEKHNFPNLLQALFLKHSVPHHLVESIVENLHWFYTLVHPFPNITIIHDLEVIYINNEPWTFIETHGHAKGQMMLYNMQKEIMICGDQVLPHITPHVGVVAGEEDESPLLQFITCLKQIKQLEVKQAFAGHGEMMNKWQERIDSILAHHDGRLSKMQELIGEYKTVNAFEMCNHVFGEHLHQQPQNLRFAITEIIAHLDYLADRGEITKRISMEQLITYSINKEEAV